MPAKKAAEGFSSEEKAAMRERVREMKARASKEEGERAVLAKIAEMRPASRALGARLHALIKAHAPQLASRTWYGMPAYTKDDEIVCYFRPSEKFGTRYSTLGFSDQAKLDEGNMWPTEFALTALSPVDEARFVALLQRAIA